MWFFLSLFIFVLFLFDLYNRFGRTGRLIKEIPGPKPWPLIGNIIEYLHSPEKLFIFQRSLLKLYGDVNQLHGLGVRMVNISNPDDIEKVLSTPKHNHKDFPYTFLSCWLLEGLLISNGSKWQHRRKMLTKAFHFNILKTFYVTFVEETDMFLEQVQEEVGKSRTDLMTLISSATLRIICETTMGKLHEDLQKSMNGYFKSLYIMGDCFTKRLGRAWLKAESLFQLTNIAKDQKRAAKYLHDFTNKIIEYRRKHLHDSYNLFDEDFETYGSNQKLAMMDLLLKNEKLGLIDNDGIREEVETFLFAGHDTTATAISFMLMALANEPEIQEKLYEEICTVYGDSDRIPTVEDLNQMKYLECCIKESLRLYPSVPMVARHLLEDLVLGGYTVPANSSCFISIYDLHHRSDLYPEPERFIPERFFLENSAQRHPYAFIPFSAGPRNCIGQKFALLEMKSIVLGLLRKFRLEPVTKPSDLVFKTDLVLRTVHPIYVRFCSR